MAIYPKQLRFLLGSSLQQTSAPPCGALDSFRKFGLGRLAIKVKLVCDLKSLRRNVIMQVLFPAAVIVLVPVHRFLVGKSCILMRASAN